MAVITQAQFKQMHGLPVSPSGPLQARGRTNQRHETGRFNKTELRYSQYLDLRKAGGEIHDWFFEEFKMRLADGTWLLPDFVVQRTDGTLEIHEVKGRKDIALKSGDQVERAYSQEDANVKLKVSARIYRIFAHYRVFPSKTGEWILEPKN